MVKKMIKTVFMGTPEFAVPILKVLKKYTEVVLVVTKPDAYIGRKKILTSSPVKIAALEDNIPVFEPVKIRTNYENIKEAKPDLIVTCAYGQIVPKEVLDIPRLGCINVHASLLPKYRGGAPIETAIINGETETGITIMYMDIGMDTGDIIKMKSIPIEKTDTNDSMHKKLSILGAELLEEILPSIIAGNNSRIPQNGEEATYAPIIKREMEHLDFHKNAIDIYNQVRGLYLVPLANFLIDNEEYKVLKGFIGSDITGTPGEIVDITKEAIGIACQDKIFYITEIKPSGKKAMLVKDYLNGIKKEKLLHKKVS